VERWPPTSPARREAEAGQPTSAAVANQGRQDNVGSGNSDFSIDIPPVEGLPVQPTLVPGSALGLGPSLILSMVLIHFLL
jgi:hypothetical protein